MLFLVLVSALGIWKLVVECRCVEVASYRTLALLIWP
jgi:hypothetical protein